MPKKVARSLTTKLVQCRSKLVATKEKVVVLGWLTSSQKQHISGGDTTERVPAGLRIQHERKTQPQRSHLFCS